MVAHFNLIEETGSQEKRCLGQSRTQNLPYFLWLLCLCFVILLMSRCDNQYFSSVRISVASSNTLDGFNIREPQGNKTTDSLDQQSIV